MDRHDYAFPFRIAPASRQAAQSDYELHVAQMIRQVLLTDPGERVDLPEFGAGLRRLIFAPHSEALASTTQILVQQALKRWLAGQIDVQRVQVSAPGEAPEGQVQVLIEYTLIETRSEKQLELTVK